jgi:putative heme-binding domain-containing protein
MITFHPRFRLSATAVLLFAASFPATIAVGDSDVLQFSPADGGSAKHVVLVSGDEEYRSEETMPMLAKILSQTHGFRCTVIFAHSADGKYIDPNNQQGLRGLKALDDADLMIIGTRFRQPNDAEAAHVTKYLNSGKPVIGIRTATHAFNGDGDFGGSIPFGQFGRKILGEQWVNHHGRHKQQGAHGVVEPGKEEHPILRSVSDVFAPSDVYGVTHLTEDDNILMRGAVTETLDPDSEPIAGEKNDPMQPFAWLHNYSAPNGTAGRSFCTTGGASVDFVSEDFRRMIVNAALFLTDREVPAATDVGFIDPFYPSFYGFIGDDTYWQNADLQPADYGLGKSPSLPDPQGSPEWNFRPTKDSDQPDGQGALPLRKGQRIAAVGNSLAERMNLFGHFETLLHTRFPDKELVFRNFGWPADEVANQQRPSSYTTIDDPLEVFGPDMFMCFFGFNESFAGRDKGDIEAFISNYRSYIAGMTERFARRGKEPKFVLISPTAFEATGNPLQPAGAEQNENIKAYVKAIGKLAHSDGHLFVDLFTDSQQLFGSEPGAQFTINGVHVNEQGDAVVGQMLDSKLFGGVHPLGVHASKFNDIRHWVNDKSWFHLQDYRMLNGWYVYGGRRTWDTETFPTEYRKIRNIVSVRDRYLWDMAAGREVPDQPDDSDTGEVFEPETMFGTRDNNFREMREPAVLKYPTPEESIEMMSVPEGFKVELFASEREFPELANPNQIAFDSRGRLWVSCMANYPQWQPGSAKPSDRLLILEDTDKDGMADKCTTFYDKLICPTGFEFSNGGVLVVDEPRILFIKDTDGDDRADHVQQMIDGIATDDTHHTVGAWEFSHGGLLHMLEGISLSTTMETPWGPFRNKGTGGGYVFDPLAQKFSHYRTPGYGNPWCLVFDQWGNGIVGDGTNAKQHWISPLYGKEVVTRRTMEPVFDNEGMRPAVGNEFLLSRHFPDDVQGQFIYACVINMHGLPRFNVRDQPEGAGFEGERVADLLSSTDMIFRPVDPKIGPDGALWFGDWCNALIGHMQYSQRDPNRDHEHGRVYRLVYENKELLEPVTQAGKSIPELLDQLTMYELRTRYRARRELRDRDQIQVLAAIDQWIDASSDARQLCEAMWIQESFRSVDPILLDRIMASDEYRARAAAIHTLTNERDRQPTFERRVAVAMSDPHPRVRLEAIRAASFLTSPRATKIALSAVDHPTDYWVDYTLEHTLHALEPQWKSTNREAVLAGSSDAAKNYLLRHERMTGPGGAAVKPLATAEDVDAPIDERMKAVKTLVGVRGGDHRRGEAVYKQVCSACHMIGDLGKKFGPDLSGVAARMNKQELITSILMPNDKISKGYETISVLTFDGLIFNGFILNEDDETISLGVADAKGSNKAKQIDILKDDIELRREMKASSMPEGLIAQIAPIEFLDLVAFLERQKAISMEIKPGGWISAKSKEAPKLREHNGFQEISRSGAIQLGPTMTNESWHDQTHLFLTDAASEGLDFVFHSAHDAEQPAVTIQLPAESEVRHVWLQNRLSSQFHERAEGLTVWTSSDGKEFKKVWSAEKPQAEWMIDLPEGTRARYLRVGLDGKGTFHLNRGAVFGR